LHQSSRHSQHPLRRDNASSESETLNLTRPGIGLSAYIAAPIVPCVYASRCPWDSLAITAVSAPKLRINFSRRRAIASAEVDNFRARRELLAHTERPLSGHGVGIQPTLFLSSSRIACTEKVRGGCSKRLLNALRAQSTRKGRIPRGRQSIQGPPRDHPLGRPHPACCSRPLCAPTLLFSV